MTANAARLQSILLDICTELDQDGCTITQSQWTWLNGGPRLLILGVDPSDKDFAAIYTDAGDHAELESLSVAA